MYKEANALLVLVTRSTSPSSLHQHRQIKGVGKGMAMRLLENKSQPCEEKPSAYPFTTLVIVSDLRIFSIMANRPTLPDALALMVGIFHEYAGKDGNACSLNKGEFKDLIDAQFPQVFQNSKDKEGIQKLMNDLDRDKSGEIDFTEYMTFLASLAVVCNEYLLESLKGGKKPCK
uniref:Protein S100-A2-like n=1 Tax=Erpetoichthys calabaricus TaxID=27687 RepID=A0A8C4RML3_ERPCA